MSQLVTVNFIAPSGVTTALQGKAGKSLMELATAKNLGGIAADCGGLMTCATCHVFVAEPYFNQLPEPCADELAMLAFTAEARQPNSRLSCQITLTAALDGMTVTLPTHQY